ncbi:hypothetical protein [Kitasatospora sp. NPDC098663]|uniref:hypothetical protein n=1 Tax=Kitasatospora sp. NPDC098663 TaxID=3364096 RepID=UPI00382A538E
MSSRENDNGLSPTVALGFVKGALNNGLTPDRRHLEIALGPVAAAEFATLIKRKQEAEAREMARRIARRNGETQNRVPIAGADIDLEKAISEAVAELKADAPKPSSTPTPADPAQNSAEPESVDPRAILAEWEANRRKGKGGKHPGYVLGPMKTDGSQPIYRRDEVPSAEQAFTEAHR